ncbi:hypothetical protein Hanom_Chr11g01010831 [Helianthus anomalus]
MTDEHILRLTDMKVVDDTTIDETPSEPNATNLDGLDEIAFGGDVEKLKYVREDGTEFNPFDEDWLKDNASQALRFQRVACYCYYRGIHAESSRSEAAH